jgi:hypothetical protein
MEKRRILKGIIFFISFFIGSTLAYSEKLELTLYKTVALAEELFRLAKEQYSNGLITSLDYQNAQMQLNSAQLGYLQAVYNYKQFLFDLMDKMCVDSLGA